MPAPISVAAWRVIIARSIAPMRWKLGSEMFTLKRGPLEARSAAAAVVSEKSVTKMPSRRSRERALRAVSASRLPRVFLPAASTPLYA